MPLENLVKRSTVTRRLFDVVAVDFEKEQVTVLESNVEFEDAVGHAEFYKDELKQLA